MPPVGCPADKAVRPIPNTRGIEQIELVPYFDHGPIALVLHDRVAEQTLRLSDTWIKLLGRVVVHSSVVMGYRQEVAARHRDDVMMHLKNIDRDIAR